MGINLTNQILMDGLVPNSVCLDASNCNQVNAFSHSSWKIPSCFCFSLYHFWRAFHSVVNCTCSLLFFTIILHFLFTTVVQPPFSAKAFQGSLHLMCIINRLNKRATSKKKKKTQKLCKCLDNHWTNQNHYMVFWSWCHCMALTAGRFSK